jgi:1,2-phenylacetyl-CoA epoxidase PaaB subunit
MFAIIKDNAIEQLIPSGQQFTIEDIQYSNNWVNLSTPEEKQAIGMVDVVYGARPDDKYYWVTESAPVIANNVVEINYTSTAKDLADLKKTAISQVNAQAYSLLAPTDYMSIKALETGNAMPDAWKIWRESIRTSALNAKNAINTSTDIDSLISASTITWAHDPDYVAPTENQT